MVRITWQSEGRQAKAGNNIYIITLTIREIKIKLYAKRERETERGDSKRKGRTL